VYLDNKSEHFKPVEPKDFSGQNLSGRSFKGQNLEGANFSYADIRGANFTNANLRGANFSYAQAGLEKSWLFGAILVVASLVLSALSKSVILALLINLILFIGIVTLVSKYNWAMILTANLVIVIAGFISGCIALAISWFINGSVSIFVVLSASVPIALGVVGFIYLTFVGSKGGIISTSVSKVKFGLLAFLISIVEECVKTAIVNTYGTSFRWANLTDANFTAATLKHTNFAADITRTCLFQTKGLEYARLGTTYLQNPHIRQLLVTREGQDKNFDYLDLQGINLQKANLQDASFIGTDISKANLQDANLSRARLVQANLNATDFTGATLTGAYIQDWNITRNTKFDGVRCEYVYMRFPTKEDPNPVRKPDNYKEVFADGEFADFIQPIFDTLDLYHNQQVDPRAIAISFKKLAENHPEAVLQIVGMEVRGEDKFLLRAKTADNANKSELSDEYFKTYHQIKGLPEREIQLLLAEKDNRIRSLETMVMTALERPNFYSNTQIQEVGSMISNPGGFSVGESVHGNINNVQGDSNKVVQRDIMTGDRNINTGGGNYNERIQGDYVQGNKYAGQPQSLAEAAAEIQALLKQLEQKYPTATTSEKMVVAAQAVDKIESNPLLKQRVINAIKEGSLAAFEKAIDNPVGAFVVHAIQGWQEVKKIEEAKYNELQ
jgi:uncharacterized protein YjbI with pentapeptide repeats